MVKKIFSHSLSGCMSCMGLCRILLEIVRPTTCYRINPQFWEFGVSKCIHCGILKKEMWMHHIVFAPQDLQKHQRGLNIFCAWRWESLPILCDSLFGPEQNFFVQRKQKYSELFWIFQLFKEAYDFDQTDNPCFLWQELQSPHHVWPLTKFSWIAHQMMDSIGLQLPI